MQSAIALVNSRVFKIFLIAAVVVFAFYIRFTQIFTGLPYWDYWDEPQSIRQAIDMYLNKDFVSEFFNYGNLPAFVALASIIPVFAYLKISGALPADGPVIPYPDYRWSLNYQELLIAPRTAWILFAMIGLLAVWLVTYRIAGYWAGLLAGLFVAVNPQLVYFSTRAVVDGLAASLAWVSLAVAVEGLVRGRTRWLYAAAFLAGFTAAAKYNYGVVVIAPLLALFILHGWTLRKKIKPILVMGICTLVGFFIPMYSALINPRLFLGAIEIERVHYQSGHTGNESDPWLGQFIFQWNNFVSVMSVWGIAFAFVGAFFIFLKKSQIRNIAVLITVPFVPLFLVLLSGRVNFHRNLLAMYPMLIVLMAYAIYKLTSIISSKSKFVAVVFLLVILVPTFVVPLQSQMDSIKNSQSYVEPRQAALAEAYERACKSNQDVYLDETLMIVTRGTNAPCAGVKTVVLSPTQMKSMDFEKGIYVFRKSEISISERLTHVKDFVGSGWIVIPDEGYLDAPIFGVEVSVGDKN